MRWYMYYQMIQNLIYRDLTNILIQHPTNTSCNHCTSRKRKKKSPDFILRDTNANISWLRIHSIVWKIIWFWFRICSCNLSNSWYLSPGKRWTWLVQVFQKNPEPREEHRAAHSENGSFVTRWLGNARNVRRKRSARPRTFSGTLPLRQHDENRTKKYRLAKPRSHK